MLKKNRERSLYAAVVLLPAASVALPVMTTAHTLRRLPLPRAHTYTRVIHARTCKGNNSTTMKKNK